MSTPVRTRAEFQQLAVMRLDEAKVLLAAGKWAGAYYLAGYAVECALKACIARLMRAEDFPDKNFAAKCYTHNLKELLVHSGLKAPMDAAATGDAILSGNWGIVIQWSEETRYHTINESEARDLYTAIDDAAHGVLPWLKTHW